MSTTSTETTKVVVDMDLAQPANARVLKARVSVEGRRPGIAVPMMARDVLTNPDYDRFDAQERH